jgi:hypothetical protein
MGQFGTYTTRVVDGLAFTVWCRRSPVPRIQDVTLNSTIYLYKSKEEAEKGEHRGGSGFLASVRSEQHATQAHLYAVTNTHVIALGYSVVRLTTAFGVTQIIPFGTADWLKHPNGDDVSVCPLALPAAEYVSPIPVAMFLSEALVKEHDIGPGDDVVMIGRFIAHGGRQRNRPTARFGNISMMPGELIDHPKTGLKQEAFLVETHSITGFSGSAVLVELPGNTSRPVQVASDTSPLPVTEFRTSQVHTTLLLGIDFGHLPHFDDVIDNRGNRHPDGWRVASNSAIMAVIPAWRIKILLDMEELKEQRKKEDERFSREMAQADAQIVLDTEDTFTKADFEQALRKVSRRIQPSQSDEEK